MIEFSYDKPNRQGTFSAKATGSLGEYIPGREEFACYESQPQEDDSDAKVALKRLINRLTEDGWEQYSLGTYWYDLKFRKRSM